MKINSRTCLKCYQPPKHPIITARCTVIYSQTNAPGSVELMFKPNPWGYGTLLSSIRIAESEWTGIGELFNNGDNTGSFLLYYPKKTVPPRVEYTEYNNDVHLKRVSQDIKRRRQTNAGTKGFWNTTISPSRTYTIECEDNALSPKNFMEAIRIYRILQLRDNVDHAPFHKMGDKEYGFFDAMTPSDINRAVMSMKLVQIPPGNGTIYLYEQCGTYNWRFVLPFCSVLVLIFFLFLFVSMITTKDFVDQIPFNSHSWYIEALRSRGGGNVNIEVIQKQPWWMLKMFDGSVDEMILVRNERGHRIDLCLGNEKNNANTTHRLTSSREMEVTAMTDEGMIREINCAELITEPNSGASTPRSGVATVIHSHLSSDTTRSGCPGYNHGS